MRVFLGLGLVFGMACAVAAADEKIDAKKLLGKWEAKTSKVQKLVIEFADAGKVNFVAIENGKEYKAAGTYKLDGNKLVLDMLFGDTKRKMTRTITKITDNEIVSKNDDKDDQEETLVRVQEKKDKKDDK